MKNNKSDKRKKEIADAASELISENGYHATTISDITKKLNMAHGTFYHYFQSKEDIFYYIVDVYLKKFTGLFKIIEKDLDKVTTFTEWMEKLTQIMGEFIKLYTENPQVFIITFYRVPGADINLEKKVLQVVNKMHSGVEVLLTHGVNNRFFKRGIDIEVISKLLVGMMFTLFRSVFEDKEAGATDLIDRWFNAYLSMVIDGIG